MLRTLLLAPLLACAAVSCGDDAPVGIPPPCRGPCVAEVLVDLEDVVLTPGDTVRLGAVAKSADGTYSTVQWTTWNAKAAVDSTGLVTAVSKGMTAVYARPVADTAKLGVAEIWVVDPDTGGQPFLTGFRDARTGEPLPRLRGFAGRDSIALSVSYVLGQSATTLGLPHVVVEIRRWESNVVVWSRTLPLDVRGQGAMVPFTIFLTEANAFGQRVLPSGAYDLFVLLPLADGIVLGEQTGYRISF